MAQFHRSLGPGWALADQWADGCVIASVPREHQGDLITLTIGGNDLLTAQERWLAEGLGAFKREHLALLQALRARNPGAVLIVGNVYAPQFQLEARRLALLHEANGLIAANVTAVGAQLADINARFRGNDDALLCRLIEPTLAGAAAIAELFRQARLRTTSA